jgi:SAM-dependent methyltransferase
MSTASIAIPLFDSGVGLRSERHHALERLSLRANARLLLLTPAAPRWAPPPRIEDLIPGLDGRTDLVRSVLPARTPLAAADADFDAVVLHGVLDRVTDPCAVLAECSRVLRPGGRISVYGRFLPPGFSPPLWRRVAARGASLIVAVDRDLDEILAGAQAPLAVDWQKAGCVGTGLRLVQLRKLDPTH